MTTRNDDDGGITVNGPVFGLFMTLLLWAAILGFIWGMVVTEGMLFFGVVLAAFVGLCGFIVGWVALSGTKAFYAWAARGFKAAPSSSFEWW